MIKNGINFEIKDGKLQIGDNSILLPKDEDDGNDFLLAIALTCCDAIGNSIDDEDGEVIDSYSFFDEEEDES